MSGKYKASGPILNIGETQTFGSGFTKRELVITTEADSKYPQAVKFEVTKDKCVELDQYKLGQNVTVSFNLRGNEYNGKYFVNLQAWKIEADGPAPQQEQRRESPGMPTAPTGAVADEDDDIPF